MKTHYFKIDYTEDKIVMDFLSELNEVQQQAVQNINGPSLVIAGAGSGKTRVLTYRIAYLLSQGIPANKIMALTFTNKAAREMKERIAKLTDEATTRHLWMGTFHSLFARILRREAEAIGYPSNFTIYDADDSKNLLKTIIRDLKLDDQVYKPNDMLRRISSAKNNLISADQYAVSGEIQSQDSSARKPSIGDIYRSYSLRCKKAGAMDFDDLLVQISILFRDHPDILKKYQSSFRYVLVDEYQDTNFAQYVIIKKLASEHRNICVVGDDSQSIYSFRGAKIENILNFRNDYPEFKIYKLEQNYRSTQNIVNAANSLISRNQNRIPKEIWSKQETGEKLKILEAMTDQEEGFLIASGILDAKHRFHLDYDAFAILYRTNAQSRILEEACRKRNIPYRVFGSISFYQRKEVKDALAYFKLAFNPKDDEALKRIINYPARGIGKTSLDRLSTAAFKADVSIWGILQKPDKYVSGFNKGTLTKLEGFRNLIESFIQRQHAEDAYDLGLDILSKTGILKEFAYEKTPESLSKYENLQELLNGIREFSETEKENNPDEVISLSTYIENIALLTDQDTKQKDDSPKVFLMTIHAAKGLEFSHVYIAGMEEELFPSQFSSGSAKELEEERRLFYVALTRAKKQITISYAQTRFRWGNLVSSRRSRFIQEINSQFIELPETFQFGQSEKQGKRSFNRPIDSTGSAPLRPSRNLVRVKEASGKPATDNNFIADDPDKIQTGMSVAHARFGKGKVLQIEGTSPNRKATVFFKTAGQKQLLLKFARLKILKS